MTRTRYATGAFAALFTLAACAENPVAPEIEAGSSALFARAASHPYTFTRLDVAGATQTIPSGINADGKVVGWYIQGGVTRGFTYQDGAFTLNILYPNSVFTQLRGISPGGDIVGTYRNAGEPTVTLHGFVLTTEGDFIPVNFPGHTSHISQRIMPDGTILGCYHDTDQMTTMHGVAIEREAYMPHPNTSSSEGYSSREEFASMTNGGAPGGTSTGLYTDMDTGMGRGFVIDGGTFTGFDAPGSDFTAAWDMNPGRAIVGLFETAGTSSIHGFVLEHWRIVDGQVSGDYTTIDYPLSATTHAAYTDVFGINSSGDIVGKYRETSATSPAHGYIATRRTGD